MARSRVRRRVRRRRRRARRPKTRVYRRRRRTAPRRRRRRARRNVEVQNPPRRRRRRRRSPRRRRRARRNPLYRTAEGRYTRRARNRRLKRKRRGGWANPRRRFRLLSNPLEAIKDAFADAFSGDTLETVFHTGLGFGGTLVGSRLIYKELITALGGSAVGRVGTTAVTGILTSALLGMVGGRDLGVRALAGGLLATLWQGLSEAVRDTKAADWIPTLGEGESEEFRKAIEHEVLRELKGGMGEDEIEYEEDEEGMSYYLPPAGSEEYLPAAGSEAYLTSSEGEETTDEGMAAYLTRGETVAAEAGVGENEFGPESLPERF